MRIVADENIPCVKQAFSELGQITCVQGRNLSKEQIQDAEILLVRSVTKVNRELLQGTPVRFVGSATIGFDHVDLDYLAQNNIGFARAPGSNATSASEYVVSALLVMAQRQGFDLQNKTVGIIGCGNVGSRVLHKLQALGISCLINDPPLQHNKPHAYIYSPLDELLAEADIVTLHVPLERAGEHPTWRLADSVFFDSMKKDALLINTSRGAVVDEQALRAKLANNPGFSVVLDVWNGEPAIDLALLPAISLATPHIAGYSFDGKIRGTRMLYQALCEYFSLPAQWLVPLPEPPLTNLSFSASVSLQQAIQTAVLACYDVRADDANLRRIGHSGNPPAYFDALRKNYPVRREFDCVEIRIANQTELTTGLRGLGFNVTEV